MSAKTAYRAWVTLLLGLMGLGFAAWLYQLGNGLTVTGMNNVVSWGLYIIAFMYFVGLSAGGLIMVAGAHLAGIQQFRPLARLAVILSGAAVVVAALFLLPDLGHPERAYHVLIGGQFYSPLVWDVIVISTFIIIAAVDLWLLSRPRQSEPALTVIAIVSLPAAILLASVDAWIFGLLVARPFWNSPLLAPLFVSSALVSGLALLLVVTLTLRKLDVLKVEQEVLSLLAKLMAWFIAIDLFFLFAEVLTAITSNVSDHKDQTLLLLNGNLAPFFWPEVILGGVVPFTILALPQTRQRSGLLAVAGALALGGILLKRINIMMASMSLPLIDLAPGQTIGRYVEPGHEFWLRLGEYAPTWVEWSVAAGIVAFGALLVTLGVRYLVRRPAPAFESQPAGLAAPGVPAV
jgi:molybdopterin-containing oxidoreductase family membrane subunit